MRSLDNTEQLLAEANGDAEHPNTVMPRDKWSLIVDGSHQKLEPSAEFQFACKSLGPNGISTEDCPFSMDDLGIDFFIRTHLTERAIFWYRSPKTGQVCNSAAKAAGNGARRRGGDTADADAKLRPAGVRYCHLCNNCFSANNFTGQHRYKHRPGKPASVVAAVPDNARSTALVRWTPSLERREQRTRVPALRLTGYKVSYSINGGQSWQVAVHNTSNAFPAVYFQVPFPGQTYSFSVAAINSAGILSQNSEPSAGVYVAATDTAWPPSPSTVSLNSDASYPPAVNFGVKRPRADANSDDARPDKKSHPSEYYGAPTIEFRPKPHMDAYQSSYPDTYADTQSDALSTPSVPGTPTHPSSFNPSEQARAVAPSFSTPAHGQPLVGATPFWTERVHTVSRPPTLAFAPSATPSTANFASMPSVPPMAVNMPAISQPLIHQSCMTAYAPRSTSSTRSPVLSPALSPVSPSAALPSPERESADDMLDLGFDLDEMVSLISTDDGLYLDGGVNDGDISDLIGDLEDCEEGDDGLGWSNGHGDPRADIDSNYADYSGEAAPPACSQVEGAEYESPQVFRMASLEMFAHGTDCPTWRNARLPQRSAAAEAARLARDTQRADAWAKLMRSLTSASPEQLAKQLHRLGPSLIELHERRSSSNMLPLLLSFAPPGTAAAIAALPRDAVAAFLTEQVAIAAPQPKRQREHLRVPLVVPRADMRMAALGKSNHTRMQTVGAAIAVAVLIIALLVAMLQPAVVALPQPKSLARTLKTALTRPFARRTKHTPINAPDAERACKWSWNPHALGCFPAADAAEARDATACRWTPSLFQPCEPVVRRE